MKEHEVIAKTLVYLIKKEQAEINSVATPKKHEKYIKKAINNAGLTKNQINLITFKQVGADIIAVLKFKSGRPQKRIQIEAKGGNVYYGIYTALGQFICLKESPSTYHWFAFAFPLRWREKIRKWLLTPKERIKPVIRDIINLYTKNGQGLWFYFINEKTGKAIKETWETTLR
ncbi:hypothetical protein A2625_04050 [candidate division WOR-1 bacterium RIFCSPHIGHO2_01_FULL_53_15]|uniref:Uncharacterized protein n=1 Tax=candidate division WOR-1 bacterium RIFCSPHIGHO2_01_FULL_53_15 TaxID=1802564 RepID=A0A1F4Q064_UNCSA|nr:MAG: hypothetical protein A2625_04050 [candidate division WOR-1 bacterium RIFCSPHIGHO2_01_FULL_53_15]OGC12942.1 MAG: hypothetical protein A3D23_05080 [candidate division WOR-1 bacterium RIFCSPHIGHO2_02_FULL_53_26]